MPHRYADAFYLIALLFSGDDLRHAAIAQVLSHDRHFKQEGYEILL